MLVRATNLPRDQFNNLTIINRSREHLLVMINDALNLYKIEAGRVEPDPQVFDLPQILEDIGYMFEVRAADADVGKLRRILINLLGNAIKFTDKGGISLHRRTEIYSK